MQAPTIIWFDGTEFDFLSNFHEAPTQLDGLLFPTSENAFQAAKTVDLRLRRRFVDIDPGAAKALGRSITLRPDWERVKFTVMREVVWDKFTRNGALADKLRLLLGVHLVEGNSWHDNIWGVCMCNRCPKLGGNALGKVLMETRTSLWSQQRSPG